MTAPSDLHALFCKIRALGKVYEKARSLGAVLGAGNAKTDSPGTYRPVGSTCPASCPYLGAGCYAQQRRTHMAAVRASAAHYPAVVGAVAAVRAGQITGRLARLHVSGDLGATRAEIDAYCSDLIAALTPFGGSVESPIAWTYTHHHPRDVGPWLDRLRAIGVAIRRSDYSGRWGVIVLPSFAPDVVARARREASAPVVKCRAQLPGGATCATCRICWDRPDLVVAFRPDGGTDRRIGAVLT